jgi:hypothetical protein
VLALSLCAFGEREPEVREDLIHRPEDVAPREQVIVPRHYTEYRARGGLLRQAAHKPSQVDTAELRRRKLKMYDGGQLTVGIGETPQAPEQAAPVEAMPARDDGGFSWAAFVFWGFIGLCFSGALLLITRVIADRRPH